MTTVLITGGIGSGKSEVCRRLVSRGYPVYDSDSRAKALYDEVPGLAARVDEALGGGVLDAGGRLDRRALAAAVFADPAALRRLESVVHPEVLADFLRWRDAQGRNLVFMESAIAAESPLFKDLFDAVVLVDAPESVRLERACSRDSAKREAVLERIRAQRFDGFTPDHVIVNDGSLEELRARTDETLEKLVYLQHQIIKDNTMKTDLSKILSVSGHHGLYRYIAQARNGAIAESLADKKRTVFDIRSRITTLADIAIFTSEGELRLKEVFGALQQALGEADAPAKGSSDELKALFAKAVPDYDEDRFYVSHMKKVSEWYNELKAYASLDFVEEEEEEAAEEASADPAND
jgi:dephospho-CoA kinase